MKITIEVRRDVVVLIFLIFLIGALGSFVSQLFGTYTITVALWIAIVFIIAQYFGVMKNKFDFF